MKGRLMEFEHLRNEIIEANTISNQMYSQMDVKRGLRNADGSGVLAGLSRISSVIGVEQSNGSRQPTDGVLKYRGRVIQDLVTDTNGLSRFEYVIFYYLPEGRLQKMRRINCSNFFRITVC